MFVFYLCICFVGRVSSEYRSRGIRAADEVMGEMLRFPTFLLAIWSFVVFRWLDFCCFVKVRAADEMPRSISSSSCSSSSFSLLFLHSPTISVFFSSSSSSLSSAILFLLLLPPPCYLLGFYPLYFPFLPLSSTLTDHPIFCFSFLSSPFCGLFSYRKEISKVEFHHLDHLPKNR